MPPVLDPDPPEGVPHARATASVTNAKHDLEMADRRDNIAQASYPSGEWSKAQVPGYCSLPRRSATGEGGPAAPKRGARRRVYKGSMRAHSIGGLVARSVIVVALVVPGVDAQGQLGVSRPPSGATFSPGPPTPPPPAQPPVIRPPAARQTDLFRATPETYAPHYDRIRGNANYIFGALPYGYVVAPDDHTRGAERAVELPAPPAAPPAAAALPPGVAPAAPVARPGHRRPLYVIPRCYAGDTKPRPNQLKPGCRMSDLRLLTPAVAVMEFQERDIPKDSQLVTIRGCAKGRVFIVGARSEDNPGTLEIAPGRRFRMSKDLLEDIKRHERMGVELVGLVRKSDVRGPGGIAIAGGRVRIGGALPRAGVGDVSRDANYSQAVIDVESWRSLPDACI
jgi:hypothetical protein